MSAALLMLFCTVYLSERFKCPSRVQKGLVLGILLLLFAPYHGINGMQVLRGFTGDLSLISIGYFIWFLSRRWIPFFPRLSPCTQKILLRGTVVMALVLYPMALGFSPVDPYRWGAHPQFMLMFLVVQGMLLSFLCPQAALFIALVLGGYWAQVLESTNLWDYLIDPFFSIGAVFAVTSDWIKSWKRSRSSPGR